MTKWFEYAVVALIGGLLGFFLGNLPPRWVYVIAVITAVLALVVFGMKV